MEVLEYAAFTTDPAGGNPAGVVLDARGLDDRAMLRIAADLGHSETAFLLPRGEGEFGVRYFSPLAEVVFCGHATIAAAVAHAERSGTGRLRLTTGSGLVEVDTARGHDGRVRATLTSVAPRSEPLPPSVLTELLGALGWREADLDPALPPRVAFGGAFHPVLAAAERERLAALDYDFPALQRLMAREDWTTVDLVWRAGPLEFHARNPFPPGGVVEDPATGAAAAAFGGYLRDIGAVAPPATVTVHQGEEMGRPSLLTIDVPVTGGIRVTGTAVAIRAPL